METMKEQLTDLNLRNLYVDEGVVFLETWAGANIGGAIEEAFKVWEKTGKEVIFIFNGKVYKINQWATMDSLNKIFMGR